MQIHFMSQTWTIKDAEPRELNGDLGECNPKTNTILIDPELPRTVWLATLAHELVHIIEITLNQCLTEQQTDTIATGIVHLLKSNPDLIKLYAEEEQ